MNSSKQLVVDTKDVGERLLQPPCSHRSPIILGVCALAIAIGGFGVWGSVVPLASAIVAQGEVIVASRRKEIQHVTGGTVKQIRARDGARVRAGDVLLELDPEIGYRQLTMARSSYFANLAAMSRLTAERDDNDTINFDKELRVASGVYDDVAQLLKTQLRLFKARQIEVRGQKELLVQRVAQLSDEVAGLTAEKSAVEKQHALADTELETLKGLYRKGHTTRQRILAFEREKVRLQGDQGRLFAKIARSKKEIGAIRLQVLQVEKQRSKDIAQELRDVEQRLLDSRERFLAASTTLSNLKIVAPVDGTVVGSRVHTIGGVIRPGETVLEIVPADDKLIVEAKIRPLDRDHISTGQETNVRLTAFKQRTLRPVSGRVVYVSADRTEDARTGEAFYLAHVAIQPKSVPGLGDQGLIPGMPAEVYINTGTRTAVAYLMEPLVDSVHRAWREP